MVTQSETRSRWLYLVVGIIGLTYFVLWQSEAPHFSNDSGGYIDVAMDLADGRLDTLHFRSVGYPLFLLLLGQAPEPTLLLFIVQMLLHVTAVCVVTAVLSRNAVSIWLTSVFALLAMSPPIVSATTSVLSGALAEFCLILGLACAQTGLSTKRTFLWAVLAGSLLAFGALVRPSFQMAYLPIILTVLLLWWMGWTSREQAVMVMLSVFVFLFGTVQIVSAYNGNNFHQRTFSPLLGVNLSHKTYRVVERLPDSQSNVREILIKHRDDNLINAKDHQAQNYIWDAMPELEAALGLPAVEVSEFLIPLNLDLIKRAPLNYLQEVGYSIVLYSFPHLSQLNTFGSRILQLIYTIVHFLVFGLFLITTAGTLGLLAIIASRNALRQVLQHAISPELIYWYAVSLLVVLYNFGITVLLAVGSPRQRVSTDLLVLLTLLLSLHIWRKISPALIVIKP